MQVKFFPDIEFLEIYLLYLSQETTGGVFTTKMKEKSQKIRDSEYRKDLTTQEGGKGKP